MPKRLPGIIFVLFANLILLVHLMIPHHHHSQMVCLPGLQTQCQESDHHHIPGETDKGDDCKKNASSCVLNQNLTVPPNSLRQLLISDGDSKKTVWERDYHALLFYPVSSGLSLNLFETLLFQLTFVSARLKLQNQIHGLRAPPVA